MIERQLKQQLDRVASRMWAIRILAGLAAVWTMVAGVGAVWLALRVQVWFQADIAFGGLVAVAAAVSLIYALWAGRFARDPHRVGQVIERIYPDLNSSLLTAINQRPTRDGRYGFMQESVIRQAIFHGMSRRWAKVSPKWRVALAFAANMTAMALLVSVLTLVAGISDANPPVSELANDQIETSSAQFSLEVTPGDTEVERGSSLLVMARFTGPLPPEATLVYESVDGTIQRLGMSKTLQDPVYGKRIPEVAEPLTYHVEFQEQRSDSFQVAVFEYPKLNRADANVTYPDYTSLEPRLLQDVRHISAVEGTDVEFLCYLNKAVEKAELVDRDGNAIPLAVRDADKHLYAASLNLRRSLRLRLQLLDDAVRANKMPPEFVVNALPNKPPDLKLAKPARDVQVSPIEELQLGANAWDDYGLARVGVSFEIPGSKSQDVVLAQGVDGQERVDVGHLVYLEELQAEPDQLLAYHFWAEDMGPDGKPRRVASDMFFAEVRHFEEIFRQGQQPPGGQQQQQQQGQGNMQQANELAQLQKQIINATWNVIRRETGEEPSSSFATDARLLAESQTAADDQAKELAEKLEDPQSVEYLSAAQQYMRQAIDELARAAGDEMIDPLKPALAAEQAAYQGLLKLRAREHEVVRSSQQQQQSSSQQQGNSRSQQQLQQLELKDNENRYETQNTAQQQSEQEQQDREVRQTLNRLRELAQRQEDLNKRIKELQTALEQAKTEEEEEEIRRQLKRLREEQQQILRDTDELSSRMERPENQEQMAEAREQLEQTRENQRQSSEALQQGEVSQAAAAGTRAERKLEELREDFRKRASGRFDEEMREMRKQSEELDERQQELSQRLADLDKPADGQKSLRGDNRPQEIQEGLQQQNEDLDELLDRMRETVEEAEQTEPLLAEQLYDAFRDAQQQEINRALETTEQSLRRGLNEDAREQERVANRGIGQLRQRVERAAESVLGDESQALQRARDELKQLSEQLGDEVAQNDPRQESGQSQEGTGEQPPSSPQGQGGTTEDKKENNRGENQAAKDPPDDAGSRDNPNQDDPQSDASQPPPSEQPKDGDGESPNSPPSGQPGGQPPGQNSSPQGGKPGDARPPQDSQSPPSESQARQSSSPQNSQGTSSAGGEPNRLGGLDQFLNQRNRAVAPLGGDDFVEWSDRLRDVEEMLDDSELRSDVARIRDRARGIRAESKRHSKPPNWDLVRLEVLKPLEELQNRVEEELLKRLSKDAVVPIDRDPVPPKFADQVRRYYERLGSGN